MLQERIRKIVNEEYNKFLMREFMQPSFSWNEFNHFLEKGTLAQAIYYCKRTLGKPVGEGTSRIVFEIDDYTVLKISRSKNDIMQNLHEFNNYQKLNHNPLVPKIYGHSDDFIWIWCERVLPCTHEDFKKILGITYNYQYEVGKLKKKKNSEIGFDEYPNNNIIDNNGIDFEQLLEAYYNYESGEELDDDVYEVLMKWMNNSWFQYLTELTDYVAQYELFDDNFGIAIRDGKPTIVVLDIGI